MPTISNGVTTFTFKAPPSPPPVETIEMHDPVLEQLLMERLQKIYLPTRWEATWAECLLVEFIKNHPKFKFKVKYKLGDGPRKGIIISSMFTLEGRIV